MEDAVETVEGASSVLSSSDDDDDDTQGESGDNSSLGDTELNSEEIGEIKINENENENENDSINNPKNVPFFEEETFSDDNEDEMQNEFEVVAATAKKDQEYLK
eukprot:Trichotokara_eunicae@DN10128_c0_g1_i1.p1